jgi:hypothetical protein
MSNITILDKISSVAKYMYNNVTYKGPYKNVIFNDKPEEYAIHTNTMNNIHNGNENNEKFASQQRVLVYYEGSKTFNTIITAKSYTEINNKMNHIIKNPKIYQKKKIW